MTRTTLKINSRFDGSQSTDNSLHSIIIQLSRTTLTVAELIKHAVEAQIRDLAVCRRESASIIRQTLDQYYVVANSRSAAVHPTLSALLALSEPKINIRGEVRNAQHAFEAGAFAVVVDGQAVHNLEQKIEVHASSRVVFVCQPIARTA